MPVYPKYYYSNIDKGMVKWRAKLKRIEDEENITAHLALAGDSIFEGYNAGSTTSEFLKYAWPEQLAKYFNTKYTDLKRGYRPIYYPYTMPENTFVGNWYLNDKGFMGNARANNTTGSITIPFNGTGIKLWTAKRLTGSNMTISIDGGDPIPYTMSGEEKYPNIIEITGLSDGDHTCVINQLSTDWLIITGFLEIKEGRGVKVHMLSRAGGSSVNAVASGSLPFNQAFSADLTLIGLGTNDFGGATQTSLSTFKSNMELFIDTIIDTGSEILMITSGSRAVEISLNKTIPLQDYFNIVRDLVDDYKVAFFDLDKYWGNADKAKTRGLIDSADNVHLTKLGQNDLLNKVLNVIKVVEWPERVAVNRTSVTRQLR
jgi:lysophospholipase L1-like esterase